MPLKLIKTFFLLAIISLIAVFFWRGLQQNPSELSSPLIGKSVPKFSAPDLLTQQKILTPAIFKGHITLLNIFATWCSVCRAEHPQLMKIAKTDQVQLIGLNFKDQNAKTIEWLKKYGNPYSKIIADPSGNIGIDFGIYGTPETYLIDQQGIIRYKYIGIISQALWKKKILPQVEQLRSSKLG